MMLRMCGATWKMRLLQRDSIGNVLGLDFLRGGTALGNACMTT